MERREALEWFHRHRQLEVPWEALRFDDGSRLATAAKGIYKPAGSEFALSISQRLRSPYEDDLAELLEGGGGRARYHQEGPPTPDAPFRSFTNQGLVRCMEEGEPVGVLVQVSRAPALYSVVGLARVSGWKDGVFLLELTHDPDAAEAPGETEPWRPPVDDTRERVRADVVRRQGQAAFRLKLLKAYRGRCALTASNAPQALQAAHITPYAGAASDKTQNGLLLRADIHALFDLGLLAVDSKKMTCLLSPTLAGTDYEQLKGRRLLVPRSKADRPSPLALDQHRSWAEL
ncbi:MAG TPA: HNH endonuclease [Solirubrobacterales bacterium]|jgi:hypothetical protein|nr:HNH endonuclease [Solirubrobacterales bacterium]